MNLMSFIHQLRFEDLPAQVVTQARRCVLDLLGVAAGGTQTQLSQIIHRHAVRHLASHDQEARILFDGRRASLAGTALAGGMTIDSMDAHDGHVLTKGHAGVAVLPTVLAFADALHQSDGREFLTQIVIGYEIATRAGIALHATACDYHTSGAWNTIACAALGARNLQLDPQQTLEAMGIAEYHGPRSQMMRCIDHPTMVKDGSGWGAMTGICAALLAQDGFTGAPALTVQADAVASTWADLGERWRILDQYFKPYPVCRWAQPAVEASMGLARSHRFQPEEITGIEVWTFHEACRLATRVPTSTEQAQYSLPFSVAAALRHGRLGAQEVATSGLEDRLIHKLSTAMTLHEHAAYNQLFPAERWAHVRVNLHDGRQLDSVPTIARGNPENPLSDDETELKYFGFADAILGPVRARQIADAVGQLGNLDDALVKLLALTLAPVGPLAN